MFGYAWSYIMIHNHPICVHATGCRVVVHGHTQVVHATDGDKVMLSLPATSTIKEAGGSDISTMLLL